MKAMKKISRILVLLLILLGAYYIYTTYINKDEPLDFSKVNWIHQQGSSYSNNGIIAIPDYVKEYEITEDGEIKITDLLLPVPVVMQLPELPNGCEITSLTAVLNYYDYTVTKEEMVDKYLKKEPFYHKDGKLFGANPSKAYVGDPRSKTNGWFTYAPPIVDAANAFFDKHGRDYNPIDLSGSSKEHILKQLDKGHPVVIWVTLDLSPPIKSFSWYLSDTGEKFNAPINSHNVVLTGYAGDQVKVMNPLLGHVTYNMDKFFTSYVELGSHAMVIE